MTLRSLVLSQYQCVTDRWTDRHATAYCDTNVTQRSDKNKEKLTRFNWPVKYRNKTFIIF